MQAFLAEAQAILRAHVLAIGGNALVSYQLNEIVLLDNPHKHQVRHIQSVLIHINALRNEEFTYSNLIQSRLHPRYLLCRVFPCVG